MRRILIALGMMLGLAHAATYSVDPSHTLVGFKIKHMMISSVSGHFDRFEGNYTLDNRGILRTLTGTVQSASISTGVEQRDTHLRSSDFLDVSRYPTLTFVATRSSKTHIIGNLTLHGITKPVTLRVTFGGIAKDPWGKTRSALSLVGKINRKDFGLTWNKALEAGGVLVGDDVTLMIDIEGVAQ